MRETKRLFSAIAVVLFTPIPAHAYLDPATGSMVLQLILGGLAGIALGIKVFWRRILTFFRLRMRRDGHPEA